MKMVLKQICCYFFVNMI